MILSRSWEASLVFLAVSIHFIKWQGHLALKWSVVIGDGSVNEDVV